MSRQTGSEVAEIVRILKDIPTPDEVFSALNELQQNDTPAEILSKLRTTIGTGGRCIPAATVAKRFKVQQELETQHPAAYPRLLPGGSGPPVDTSRTMHPKDMPDSKESQINPSKIDGTEGLCDPRLEKVNIRLWTNVNISNDLAAKCISLYLTTDHPLLGHFDPELFVLHLTAEQHEFCSPLLVNSLLFWACVRLPY